MVHLLEEQSQCQWISFTSLTELKSSSVLRKYFDKFLFFLFFLIKSIHICCKSYELILKCLVVLIVYLPCVSWQTSKLLLSQCKIPDCFYPDFFAIPASGTTVLVSKYLWQGNMPLAKIQRNSTHFIELVRFPVLFTG